MTYDDMLTFVSAGKVAYLPVYPNVFILREGNSIIRRVYHDSEMNYYFIATPREMNSKDWQIVEDEQDEDLAQILDAYTHAKHDFKIQTDIMWS